ncbi:F0F1 ATP synthase subunit A [Iodidimonas sp. SYSU 1G8]|uniref:F0F1 ATP synthase subunit A n=1 Tax=Iodidimonas sp. SYSU 1G8 TaxID=3133967 RepID=UPI0031FE7A91
MQGTPVANPLEQFQIKTLVPLEAGGYDISFTNSSAFMIVAIVSITLFMLIGTSKKALVPGRWQSLTELSYELVATMLRDTVGSGGKKFFPFVFTLFMFVLTCNLIGMIPYSFTVTSHIAVTFALAAFVIVGVTILGFVKHGFGYLKLFAPSGVPIPVLFILVPIEIISYLMRPISLSVRLFANMMAGHVMLKVFAGFVVSLGAILIPLGIFPLAFLVALTSLEMLVAVLQAYIFSILTCIYLNDAIHLH